MSDDTGAGLSRRQTTAAGVTGLLAGGTPEQIHLTWGDDPARSVVVSWVSAGQAVAPRVRIGERMIAATERGGTNGLTGEATWTYHARVDGLRPGATYGYAVTADNDRQAPDPFSATFTTAPQGRAAYRFTSAAHAVGAVETFQPLFHLFNADLADPGASPEAAYRPWMPVPGNQQPEGRWYSFRVGTVTFVCLSDDDGSNDAQTRWMEAALAAARGDASIDWIVVQLYQRAARWLPLFDRYEVDLVLGGPAQGGEHPVTTVDGGVLDTSHGPVQLALGDGVAVFDVNPGPGAGGQTSISVRYFLAADADQANLAGDYTLGTTFTVVRPRSDGRRWHAR